MSSRNSLLPWLVWGALGIVIVGIVFSFGWSEWQKRRLATDKPLLNLGRVSDFTLTNQLGRAVSLEDLQGQVWVADIIFTRCPGPCVAMTRRMQELQAALPEDLPVQLISLTTDPAYDSPDVLREYAKRFRADPDRWWFLTGPKLEVVRLAVDGLKLVMMEKDEAQRESPNDLFIHSTLLVVVDKQGRLRATFESVPRELPEEEAVEGGDVLESADFEKTKRDIVKTVRRLSMDP